MTRSDRDEPLPERAGERELFVPVEACDGGAAVDLVLAPAFSRKESLNLLAAKTELWQTVGTFSGRIRAGDREVVLRGLLGRAEEHHARW